jgi:hypothetical protein
MYKSNAEDPILLLLHLSFPDPIDYYLVNNTEDITSNGQLYTAFPFSFTLPNDDVDSEPQLNITLSNVGLDLKDSFRSNTQDVLADIKVVFASVPDFSEITINSLQVRSISYSAKSINITLKYDDILNTTVPSATYNPSDFPGVFNV